MRKIAKTVACIPGKGRDGSNIEKKWKGMASEGVVQAWLRSIGRREATVHHYYVGSATHESYSKQVATPSQD